MKTDFTVGVVGNPNCGKTTLFNVLTGSRQHVGNWPGVTVEKKTGEYSHANKLIELVIQLQFQYEIIFVNDGSDDLSINELISLHKKDNNTKDWE